MMRLWLFILLMVGLAVGFALFPQVASQGMTIEVLGWHFSMAQGAFVALLVLLFLSLKLLQWLLTMLLAAPTRLLTAWRVGGRNRREQRLRTTLATMINGETVSERPLSAVDDLMPPWLARLLVIVARSTAQQVLLDGKHDDALAVALSGRMATAHGCSNRLDVATRQGFVQAWLTRFPQAPLARRRAIDLAEAAGDWSQVVTLLKGRGSPLPQRDQRMATALLALAEQEPQRALEHLREAHRLQPLMVKVTTALADAYSSADDLKSVRKLLLDALDAQDDLALARKLAECEARLDNPLLTLHMLDKRCRKQANLAQRWLLATLSLQVEDQERVNHHLRLLKQMPGGAALAWQMEATQLMEQRQWQQAALCYQQASSAD
ncbi:MAG: hypothetical protein R8J84_03135 [Mariprofundales bacterium]